MYFISFFPFYMKHICGMCRYLRQVLEESLRCGVVVPWTARIQDFDTELGGHKIPKQVKLDF
jgi:cytochrome P450